MSEHNTFPGGDTASIWYGTFDVPTFPALGRDAKADVCVVGAGIAGLSTAYLLTKAGKKVIVVDDGTDRRRRVRPHDRASRQRDG